MTTDNANYTNPYEKKYNLLIEVLKENFCANMVIGFLEESNEKAKEEAK